MLKLLTNIIKLIIALITLITVVIKSINNK